MTAEDIRRQHPRAVANQLETLKLQNEHLEAQVRSLEHEREKLKTSVKDSKASLRKAEKHITDVESAQDQERNKIWVSFIKEHLEAQVRSQEHERSTSVEDSKASLRKAEKHITDVESAQDQERNKIWVSFTTPGGHIGVCN